MHDNVICYLAAALPQMRSPIGTLGEEIELARAYLELFSIRMGKRLSFSIDACDSALAEAFPRMVVLTLVENAIKHGLAPAENGGHVAIAAKLHDTRLCVSVIDDGVGFGAAATSGTGIGLANIRARLLTAYGRSAQLDVGSGPVSGVVATISLPLTARSGPSVAIEPKPLVRSAQFLPRQVGCCKAT
jgi:sensor histidine kinase YesM